MPAQSESPFPSLLPKSPEGGEEDILSVGEAAHAPDDEETGSKNSGQSRSGDESEPEGEGGDARGEGDGDGNGDSEGEEIDDLSQQLQEDTVEYSTAKLILDGINDKVHEYITKGDKRRERSLRFEGKQPSNYTFH